MSVTPEALADLRARKESEVEALACGRVSLWARAERSERARDLIAAVSGGGVVRCVTGHPPEQTPAGQALAVVTDAGLGGGGVGTLQLWREACDAPIIWWDHVIDPVQIAEARVAGADAVRITQALVDDEQLDDCLTAAERAGCAAVVVVDDLDGAQRALGLGAEIIAATADVDPRRLREWGATVVLELLVSGARPSDEADAIIAGSFD